MSAGGRVEWRPGRLFVDGQPVIASDEFRGSHWSPSGLEAARSLSMVGRSLEDIHKHLASAAETLFMCVGGDDFPPHTREAALALQHAYSVLAAAIASAALGNPPADARRRMAHHLARLLSGVSAAERQFFEMLGSMRNAWAARFLEEEPG